MLDSHVPSVRDRRHDAARQALLRRVYGEFYEMPCLRLTAGQARRLFGLRADICHRILLDLVQRRALTCEGERYRFNDTRLWPPTGLPIAPVGESRTT